MQTLTIQPGKFWLSFIRLLRLALADLVMVVIIDDYREQAHRHRLKILRHKHNAAD